MTADEYAKSVGATPIEETLFGKRYGWDKAVDNNLELLKLG